MLLRTPNIQFLCIVIILFIFNWNIGLFAFILYGIIYLLSNYKDYYYKNLDPLKLNNNNLNCRLPTFNNPYSNYNVNEDPNLKACNIDTKLNMFNVYENSSDKTVGSTNKAIRDFYTTPITENPNNSIKFAKWLYTDVNLTCKTDNNCFQFDDIRYHSR